MPGAISMAPVFLGAIIGPLIGAVLGAGLYHYCVGQFLPAEVRRTRVNSLPSEQPAKPRRSSCRFRRRRRSGHHQLPVMLFDHSGNEVAKHQLEHEQILPRPAGWSTTRSRSGSGPPRHPDGAERGGLGPRTWRRSGSPTSARRPSCGTARPATYYNASSAGHPHGPHRQRAGPRRPRHVIRRKAGCRPDVLLGRNAVDPRERRRCARRARNVRPSSARPIPGDLEPHRRPRRRLARDRRDERQPHDAHEPGDAGLGLRTARLLDIPRAMLRRSGLPRRRRATARSAGPPRSGACRHRDLGRPAGGHRRARCALPSARPRTPTGPATSCAPTPGGTGRSETGCSRLCVTSLATASRLRPGGIDRRHGIGRAWLLTSSHHLGRGRDRIAGPPGQRQRRGLLRPGILGAVRALLAQRRPRVSSALALQHQRSSRPGHAGGHLLPDRDVSDAMESDSGVHLEVLKVDGGHPNDLCMQLQADILGVPVSRPVVAETTALGAAYAAGWPPVLV